MSNEIKNSSSVDLSATVLKDMLPERMIKVYPYELIDTNNSKAFVQENTVSIAAISQAQLDTKDELLLTDENGNKYFEMLAAITSQGKLDVSSATSVFGQELKEEDAFTCLANWYYEGELEKIKLGTARLIPAVFVIGEPFDETKYETGEQAVFIPTTMIEAKEGSLKYSANELNTEGLYEFTLANVTSIEASFTNCRILLHTDRINLDDINTFSMTVTPTLLIDKLKVKGRQLGTDTDIDFTTKTKSSVIKVSPISTQDKLSVFIDCFDANVHLSQDIALKAEKSISLEKFARKVGLPISLTTLLTDMLLYTTEFYKRFGQVPRNNDGKIDKDWKIGSELDYLSGISTQDVNSVVDGLYRNWRTQYPDLVGSDSEKIFKEIVAALSDYTAGSLAVGKGQSSFHQNYLLWYLELDTPGIKPNVDIDKKTVSLTSDKVFLKVNSKYYDIILGSFIAKPNENISELSLVESDRVITLPELSDTVTAIDKLSLPGDINTKSSQDLMYFFNMFLNTEKELQNFFGSRASITTGEQTYRWKNQTLPEKLIEYNSSEAKTTITNQIKKAYPDAHDIAVVKAGKSKKIDDVSKYTIRATKLNGGNGDAENSSQRDRGFENYIINKYTYNGIWAPIFNKDTFTTEIINYFDSNIKREDVKVTEFINAPGGIGIYLSYAFYIIRYSWEDYEYSFKTTQNVAKLSEKATIYDKAKWRELIKSSYESDTQWERYITFEEKYGLTNFTIDEIIISSIFGDDITLNFRSHKIKIPLFNKDDETIGVQRILFT